MAQEQSVSRRNFSATAGMALSAMVVVPQLAAAGTVSQEFGRGWIDAHVHVWTPDTARYPLGTDYKLADMQPPSFTADELFSHCRPCGVERIVLIQMSFYESDHRYMLDVMASHPGVFAGVAVIDYRANDVLEQVKVLAGQGIRGLRLHARGGAKHWGSSETMAAVWKLAGDMGIAICPLIDAAEIGFVDELCGRFPGTNVVVDHFARVGISGRIEPEELESLCGLARHPQCHVKTSAFYALGNKQPPYEDLGPMIRRVVDTFGVERLMWASDCPYQVQPPHSYAASIELIRDRLDFLSVGDQQWLLRDTAQRLFFAAR